MKYSFVFYPTLKCLKLNHHTEQTQQSNTELLRSDLVRKVGETDVCLCKNGLKAPKGSWFIHNLFSKQTSQLSCYIFE